MIGADDLAEKNKVIVRIAGYEYVLSGDEPHEYIQKVALFVDRKILEITRRNHTLSTSMASVLAAVNMAEEMFRVSEEASNISKQHEELKKKFHELKEENLKLKSENQKLKDKETQMSIELTKRETEIKEVRNTLATLNNTKIYED